MATDQNKENYTMAKSQKRSNREIRKPKAEKPKTNASQPIQKPGSVKGLENTRNDWNASTGTTALAKR